MNYKIIRWKNYGFINPKPEGALAIMLEKKLQYVRQGAEWMPNPAWAVVRLYSIKKGMFAWGLLKDVKDVLAKNGHTFEIKGLIKTEFRGTPSHALRPYQNDAVKAIFEHGGGVVCLPTGSGKTLLMIDYLRIMNLKSLVVVPTLDIKAQWEKHGLKNLIASTYQNPKLKDEMAGYDIVVFDECHHVAAKSLYTLSMKVKTEAILLGCSATPVREDGEDMRIRGALGEIIYQKSRKELIAEGYLANAVVHYYKPRFGMDLKFKRYADIYKEAIVENEDRNKLIIRLAIDAYVSKRKVLVLVSHIEHGKRIWDDMSAKGTIVTTTPPSFEGGLPSGFPRVVFMNGGSKDRDRDMSQYDIIIATPIYDEGYDLPALDCVILAAGGKSSIKLTQRIGRVLRPKPDGRAALIYDFVDSPKYLKVHYLKRRKILEEEFEVTEKERHFI